MASRSRTPSSSGSSRKKQRSSSPTLNITSQVQFQKFLDQCNAEVLSRAKQFSAAVQAESMPKVVLDCLPTGGYRSNNISRESSANQPEYSFYVPMPTFLDIIQNRPALRAQAQKINRDMADHKGAARNAPESRLCIYFSAEAVAYIVDLIAREYDRQLKEQKKPGTASSSSASASFRFQLLDNEPPIPHTKETDIEFAVTRACDAFVFGEDWHTPANIAEYYQHMRQYVRVPGRVAENVYFLADIFGFDRLKSQCEASVACYWGHHVRVQLYASLPSFEFLKAKLQFANEANSRVLRNFVLILINARGTSFEELLHLYGLALNKCGGDVDTALLVERLISSGSMLTILTLEEKLSVMFYSLDHDAQFKHRMLRSVIMRNVDSPQLRARACDYMRDSIDLMRKFSTQRVVFVLPRQNVMNSKLRAKLMPFLHATSHNSSADNRNSNSKSKNGTFFKSPDSFASSSSTAQSADDPYRQHTVELTLASTTYDLCCLLYKLLSGRSYIPAACSELMWPMNFQFVQIRQLPAESAANSNSNGFSMLDSVTEPVPDDDEADADDEDSDAARASRSSNSSTWQNMPFLYAPEPASSGLFGVSRPMLQNDPIFSMLSVTMKYPAQHKFPPNAVYELRVTADTEAQLFMLKWKWNAGLKDAGTTGDLAAPNGGGGKRSRKSGGGGGGTAHAASANIMQHIDVKPAVAALRSSLQLRSPESSVSAYESDDTNVQHSEDPQGDEQYENDEVGEEAVNEEEDDQQQQHRGRWAREDEYGAAEEVYEDAEE